MRLPKAAYRWAFRHLNVDGETDLFPRTVELRALRYNAGHGVIDDLAALDLRNYAWRGGRRLLIPKDMLSFRQGTQLDPLDSIIIAALLKRLGPGVERHRIPVAADRVFSYRFAPTADGRIYGTDSGWLEFWRVSRQRARAARCTHVLVSDIADFYNQIYHHVIENQLDAAGIDGVAVRIIKNFLQAYSETVSRGVPVGPHSVHLLAELSLNPVDQDLMASGLDHCRYVDDFHIFCESEGAATSALYDLANCLDVQQRLILSRHKTRILPAHNFVELADAMMENRPINPAEAALLEVINQHTGADPYSHVPLNSLDDADLEVLDEDALDALLQAYIETDPRNYSRMGWLLRRLRQVGAPGAIDFVVDNLEEFSPVIGDAARYIMATTQNYQGDLSELGERLVAKLGLPIIAKSWYLQLIILDVLATVPDLNHAESLTAQYDVAAVPVRREILRVAGANNLSGWLRGRKQDFRTMDPLSRAAYLSALPALPGDEATHWLRGIRGQLSPVERLVVRYAFRDRGMAVGDTHIR